MALEVRAAFQDAGLQIPVSDYLAGMGGADITLDQMGQVYAELEQRAQGTYDGSIKYLGIEE